MKLTSIFLLAACLQVSARVNSQQVTLKVTKAPLSKVLEQVTKQTGYEFLYLSEYNAKANPVSIQVNNVELKAALDEIFKNQPFRYEISNKTIVVSPKKTEAPLVTEGLNPRLESAPPPAGIDVTVTVVSSENNQGLEGASVIIKGSSKGVATDVNGRAVLKDVDANATIFISFTGYTSQEVKLSNRGINPSAIVVKLIASTNELQEIIINKGYYTETKRLSVSNVGQVTAKDIENQPYENPLIALQGRVPGIQVTQLTGLAGGATTVRIQGRSSINSGLEPLIVVDGVPYPSTLLISNLESIVLGGSPLNYINPNDIESIDVLKDADATAIYGSRAANGAILITTKKGKAGKNKVSVNVQQGWGTVGHFVDMMNTRQYLDMRYEAYKNDGINLATQALGSRNYDLKLWDTTRYTNWQKELIGGTAKYTNINASFSGGTTLFQYLIGANYNKQTTVFPGNSNDTKGGAYFNFSGSSSNQKFKAQFSGNYMYDENRLPQFDLTQNALWMVPNAPALYDENGNINWAKNAAGSATWTNPLVHIFYRPYNNTTKNLVSNLTLSYQLFRGLDLRSSLGYNNIESNLYLPTTLDFYRPQDQPFVQRKVQYGIRNMTSWILEPQLHYSSRIWKGKLDALLGGTVQQAKADVLSFDGTGYSTDLLMKTLSAATSVVAGPSVNSQTKFNALFGRLNYVLNEKYIIDLTARRDGSSKFGDNNKLHNFGSVGGAWIISGEKWVQKNLRFLSFAKFRSSYGITGNDQIGDFTHLSTYSIINTPQILYQGGINLNPARLPNPNLQWEETRKWQSGIDLGFFNDRIIVGATYARNRSSNQIVSYPLPTTTGFDYISENLPALIQNTSLEFTLQTTNIKNKDFSWSTGFSLTIPRNKLLSFPGIENTSYIYGNEGVIVGQSLGVIKTFRYAGVDPATGNYTLYDSIGNITSTPDFINDKTVLISNLVKFYGGIQNAIQYKNFQLDVNLQFIRQKGPNDMYYDNGQGVSRYPGYFIGAASSNQPVGILGNQWQKPGEDATFSKFSTGFNTLWPVISDAYYSYNASYIRIKNVSLSWTLPNKMLKNLHLQNMVLYFRGDNIFTFTKYKGLDPESLSPNSLPPLRVLTLGLKVDL